MDRRSFIRAFVALAGAAAAVELVPSSPPGVARLFSGKLPATVDATPEGQLLAEIAIGPSVVFRTSAGDVRFATTPDMWIVNGNEARLAGPLTWMAETTLTVTRIDVEMARGSVEVPLEASVFSDSRIIAMNQGDSMTLAFNGPRWH